MAIKNKALTNVNKRKILSDISLIIGLLIFSLLLILPLKVCKREGNYAVVIVNGEVIAEYSLLDEVEKEIKTEYGTNTLKIEGGKARIIDANCKDKICVKHFAIFNEGESIICLPHKLIVKIVSK